MNNYKFKSLQAFNWDTPVNKKKKYRQVFDRWELTYLGVELAFFNKKFDESDWEAKFSFKAFTLHNGEKDQEICNIEDTLKITKEKNEVIIDKGWGDSEPGKFWKKRDYLWEAYIDGKPVGSAKFYIEDNGVVSQDNNPYFDVVSLKLYEGPDENKPEKERVYLRRFNTSRTRYIFGEFRFINQLQKDWLCEVFFNYFDDTGLLVGRIPSLDHIVRQEPGDDVITITHGWGHKDPGSWKKDDYTLEIEYMETVVAVVPFNVGDKNQEELKEESAIPKMSEKAEDKVNDFAESLREAKEKQDRQPDKKALESAMKELDELIGLEKIKAQIREHIAYIDFLRVREEMGYKEEETLSLHSVFTGNPGTGKTTVVQMLGKIYHAMGLLSKGHVHTVESSDLISGYVRQTGQMTQEEIEKARGGILFIDEAYMLFKKGADNDFGTEAIAALITEMSDGKGDIAIMVAGYPGEMKDFVESNPGLKSRFRYYFHFDDYTPQELMKIAGFIARKKMVALSEAAFDLMETEVTRAWRLRDKSFGNARMVTGIIDDAKINLGVRIMRDMQNNHLNKKLVSTIEEEDIRDVFISTGRARVDIPTDEELLAETMKEMDQLIGLNNIKEEIRNMIKLVRYYRDINKDVQKAFPVHSIFTGNPGTGKTTVARIMGNIYKSLGILERGHLIETDASDLIAGYLGQTALKTRDKINEAMGGILFIDEAYSLTEGLHPEFGKKAVSTLIKQMEDRRGEFSVIVAGYSMPMAEFLESNPGIRSRFDQTFLFQDFLEDELFEIASLMFRNSGLQLEDAAGQYLSEYLKHLYQGRNQFFGNARSVRKIVERTVRKQNLRMASLPSAGRTAYHIHTVTLDDIKDFPMEESVSRKPIGFKREGE
ncbi:MAG: AAA family ATPase [Bacteroidetes bacterium]|nr:AAA family ATPase [Bacteroidota bacterium]